jgi:GH15 family glucan-1,4-alpha-glucosidase
MENSAYKSSLALLRAAATPLGFVASVQEHDNYRRIWTRDGTINALAALLSGDADLVACARATINTIFNHQHSTGAMPSNVSQNGAVSYGGTVGRADNPGWAVIGLCQYALLQKQPDFAIYRKKEVEKCFSVMDAWEFNGKHLMYVPMSGDWADEYIQHGYVLFDQLLRVWALQLAAKIFSEPTWQAKATYILATIQANFWKNEQPAQLYAPNLAHMLPGAPEDHWFLGFNPARIYQQFDLQANVLALLLRIGTSAQDDALIAYLKKLYAATQSLLPSFYPTIEYADAEMAELNNNYAFSFRNLPGEFHNGGLWPVWNGWLAAALFAKGETAFAGSVLSQIEQANNMNQGEFNECLHGKNNTPIGVPHCTWSAGGYVIAEAFRAGKRLIF